MINVAQFVDEVYAAQKHPNFIQGYETGNKINLFSLELKNWILRALKLLSKKPLMLFMAVFLDIQSLKRSYPVKIKA